MNLLGLAIRPRAHQPATVNICAEKIEGLVNRLHISRENLGSVFAEHGERGGGIASEKNWIEPPGILAPPVSAGETIERARKCGFVSGSSVGGGIGGRQGRRDVTGIADLGGLMRVGANGLHGAAVREKRDVRGAHVLGAGKFFARRLHSGDVSATDERARLVDGKPMRDAVGESARDNSGVVAEPLWHVAREPAAAAMQREGCVPVK